MFCKKIKKYARIYTRDKEGSINIYKLYGREGWHICYRSWCILNAWNYRNQHNSDNKLINKHKRRMSREEIRWHIKKLRELLNNSRVNW